MRVTLSGLVFNITKEDVGKKLRGIQPEEGRAKYFAEVGGKKYPVKQVISQTLNLARVAITSQQAFAILRKLGFEITERS